MPSRELLIVNYASNLLLILIRSITDWPSMNVMNNNYEDVVYMKAFYILLLSNDIYLIIIISQFFNGVVITIRKMH